jgi:hypothetical protein
MATATTRTRSRTTAAKLTQLAARLTDRDRTLIRLVHDHRVLTTSQLAQLAFDSLDRAEHRLRELTELEVLDRFRPRLPTGSAPYHYVLGPLGAHVLAAEQGVEITQLGWRRDKALSIAYSQRLGHTVGVNGFFAALAAHARRCRADSELMVLVGRSSCAVPTGATWCAQTPSPAGARATGRVNSSWSTTPAPKPWIA